jgi:hypothetical protein
MLLGPDGEILAASDSYGHSTKSRIEYVWLPETGTYMIVARGLGQTRGTYTLELVHEKD